MKKLNLINDKVNIILLNYNGNSDTIECLDSIINSDYSKIEITILDNNSAMNDYNLLDSYIYKNFSNYYKYDYLNQLVIETSKRTHYKSSPRVNLIRSNINLGFAKGNNVAIEFGVSRAFNYFFILNNDTIILKNTISILMHYILNNSSYHALIPQIRLYDQRNIIWNCGGKIKFYGKCKYLFSNKNINDIKLENKYDVTFVTGCALLIDIKKTGFFSNKYFFGEEDFDFSIRQNKNKIKMACITNSLIFHKVNSTINKANSKNISRFYYYYLCRLFNFKSNFTGIKKRFLFTLVIVKILFNSIFTFNLNLKKSIMNVLFVLNTIKEIENINQNLFQKYLFSHKWK